MENHIGRVVVDFKLSLTPELQKDYFIFLRYNV